MTLVREILEKDPTAPSHRSAGDPRRRLDADLDTIVLKALRKEHGERYGSAERMADDVRRHLGGLPITARPATVAYRARKFARRNAGALLATAAVVVLVAGTVPVDALCPSVDVVEGPGR